MANNYDTTTSFKVDISDLKAAMQDAKRAVAVANSEFKAAASTCDDWTKSSDGLKAKLKQLDTTLSSQKTILSSLERQYELTVAEMGEGSKAADDLKIKINNQKAAINKTEREFANYEETLEEVSKAEKTAAKTGQDVTEVLEDMGKEAEDAGDGFTVLKGAVATFAGNAMSSLVGGIRDGISSIMGLAEETREYRTELGKLDSAFTTAGFTTEAATNTYKELYAVLGDEGQTVEAANMLAKLVDTEAELAEWTTIATGVYGTFGSSLPIESLAEAANETSKTGALTGALADALNWAGVSEDAFQASLDGCTTEQERNALITETLNGLYSEAAQNYRETNQSVMEANVANSNYADTMAEMGARIEPVMTAIKTGFTDLLNEALKLVEDVDMSQFTTKVEEAFAVLKDDVLPAIKEGFGWILDHKDELVAGLAAVAAGFVAFKVATLIQSVSSAMQGMTVAQYALNLAMSLNPIGLVAAAIAGLVAAFVVLWNKSDAFRNFWINLWEKIKGFCSNAINAIVKFFSELPTKISTWLSKALSTVVTWGSDLAKKGKEAATNLFNNIVDTIKGLPDKLMSIGSDIVRGLWNGINDMAGWISKKIKGFGDSVLDGIKDFFGIHSPSKVMAEEVGKFIPEGLAVGIEKNAKSVLSSMRDLSINAVGTAKDSISGGITGAGVVNNFYQNNYSPKSLSRLEIYRQSKNLLGYAGGM